MSLQSVLMKVRTAEEVDDMLLIAVLESTTGTYGRLRARSGALSLARVTRQKAWESNWLDFKPKTPARAKSSCSSDVSGKIQRDWERYSSLPSAVRTAIGAVS